MLQSDHIFPLKPLNKDLLENSQSQHTCVCVCMRKPELRFAPPPKWEEVCVCLFFPSASSYSSTLPLLWLSLWIPGMCTFTLFCSSVEHVCVFIWFDFYLIQELRRSLSKKARELMQDLCAPALLHAWLSRQSDLAYGQWMRCMGFFGLDCSVGVSYFRG